ncbi:MAG TPA: SRPBCC family protein [Candidatus Thermoplasmatota archaeon]|nr:SRPBCC family protein [Candidatus Thermoplasmatota archaeon]
MPRAEVPEAARGHLLYRRRLAHAPDVAFAWLTDYDDRDAERAGHVIVVRRTVASREPSRVVLEADLDVLGRGLPGTAEVDLYPPDRWRARFRDRKGRIVFENHYRVEAAGGGGSWLLVDYAFVLPKVRHRVRYLIARPWIRRDIDRMWQGFVAAMDAELALTAVPLHA